MIPRAYKDKDGEPIDHVTEPDKQLAHKALGDYGPLGVKVSNDDFLLILGIIESPSLLFPIFISEPCFAYFLQIAWLFDINILYLQMKV